MGKKLISEILNIEHPIIMAPMFLVSNAAMIKAALDNGITGAIPALNYRTPTELRAAIIEIKDHSSKAFGINLVVNKSNIYLKGQLQACLDLGVDYIITSLGSPNSIIDRCHAKGIKVFADVINKEHAQKCEAFGADALIAVNAEAGGHCGKIPGQDLIPMLNESSSLPVISAGGVATKAEYDKVMSWGAAGISAGTIFIASEEAPVSKDYKQALIDYKAQDVILSTKLSGSPCTVINTPYVQSIGTKENVLERMIHRNKRFKRYAKFLISTMGMNTLRKAAFSATYKSVWCAGPTIEHIHAVRPASEIINDLMIES